MNGLYQDPDKAQFYDLERARGERADYAFCLNFAGEAQTVLDLGCGTWELTTALAAGRDVTGVDHARAMLDIARQRPGGMQVSWREADARSVRLDQKFDLVVLTGHVFQVFLEDRDQEAVLATIAHHLNPGGRFIFDTRNPEYPALKTRNRAQTEHRIAHPVLGDTLAWNESAYDKSSGVLTYQNSF